MKQFVFDNAALQRGKAWMYFTHIYQHDFLYYYCAFIEN